MKRVDLKRSLTLRITLFALLLLAVAIVVTLYQARGRIRTDIQRTGSTIQKLIEDEVGRTTPAFDRTLQGLDGLELSGLEGIGRLVHFCAAVDDLSLRPVADRCFGESDGAETVPHWLLALMRWMVGPDAVYHGRVGKYPGVKVGELTITPNFDSEAVTVWHEIRNLLMITGGILLLNVLVYRPVRRALRPTEDILHALGRMEAGDLNVRLPSFELIELQRISSVFNHLADRLQLTIGDQRRLAVRLLNVREDERRHLARELHDELGQCLTSIQAEAAYARELAADSLPALTPCAEAISRTTAHMMESLQLILRELRPIGLEEFGLAASLAQLVASRNRSSHGRCEHLLTIDGEVDGLPDNLNVSLYRIVQESLTNASKHGGADRVEVALRRDARSLVLSVQDNGVATDVPESSEGFGLLGMHERVQALGGSLELRPRQPRGLRVEVRLPLTEGATRRETETTP